MACHSVSPAPVPGRYASLDAVDWECWSMHRSWLAGEVSDWSMRAPPSDARSPNQLRILQAKEPRVALDGTDGIYFPCFLCRQELRQARADPYLLPRNAFSIRRLRVPVRRRSRQPRAPRRLLIALHRSRGAFRIARPHGMGRFSTHRSTWLALNLKTSQRDAPVILTWSTRMGQIS